MPEGRGTCRGDLAAQGAQKDKSWEVLRGKLWSCRPSQAEEEALGAGIMGHQLPMLTVSAPHVFRL